MGQSDADVRKIIAENWHSKTYLEIGGLVGLSAESVRKRGGRMKLPSKGYDFSAKMRKLNGVDYAEIARSNPALAKECEEQNLPLHEVKHYWHKSKKFSIFSKRNVPDYFQIRDEMIAEMQEYAPVYPVVKYKRDKSAKCLVIDPCDIHIGKLCRAFETGDEHDNQIIVDRVRSGVLGVINKASFAKIDQVVIIIGNDVLHVDGAKRETTSGTKQDTDGMWYENFLIAKSLYIWMIETCIQIAPVHIQYDPSNHDYTNGFFLADSISSWFHKCKKVTFDVSIAHRKYFIYHNNLIGSTHNDGAKEGDLALLMAHEAREGWYKCKHRYIYTHHIHHKRSKDYMSVCVETNRSASGADSWHHRQGYQHSPKAIEAFLHDKENGQEYRINHIF